MQATILSSGKEDLPMRVMVLSSGLFKSIKKTNLSATMLNSGKEDLPMQVMMLTPGKRIPTRKDPESTQRIFFNSKTEITNCNRCKDM